MTKGSQNSGQSDSLPAAYCGYAEVIPATVKTTVSGGGKGSYQTKSTESYVDKQSGCYGRATATEMASAGDFHWKNGTTGTRSEYKETATLRVGDKTGYTEVYSEQRVRNVSYDRSTTSSGSKGTTGGGSGKDYIIYDNGRGGRGYGGYY